MGTKAQEIVGMKVEELVEQLNRAYADEWLAFYQYWVAAQIASGRGSQPVVEELERIADEELEHAEELAQRIVQLGGKPLPHPKLWLEKANCGYSEPPAPRDLEKLIHTSIEAERCAASVYQKLAALTHGKDHVTYQLICHILAEELNHEDAFENLL